MYWKGLLIACLTSHAHSQPCSLPKGTYSLPKTMTRVSLLWFVLQSTITHFYSSKLPIAPGFGRRRSACIEGFNLKAVKASDDGNTDTVKILVGSAFRLAFVFLHHINTRVGFKRASIMFLNRGGINFHARKRRSGSSSLWGIFYFLFIFITQRL